MFSFLSISVTNVALLKQISYRRSLLEGILAVNSNTAKLQKLLINNLESIDPKSKKGFNNKAVEKILQNYWSEYIYITPCNSVSSSFETMLSNIYLLQSTNSIGNLKVHIDLKEYLASEKMKVFYSRNSNVYSTKLPVRYINRKPANQLYITISNLYNALVAKRILKQSNNDLLETLKKQKFPVFIVTNGAKEIIVGEPEHTLKKQSNLLKSLFHLSQATVRIPNSYHLPLREGYIFISPLDAVEYYNYLQARYPYSSNELKIRIFIGTLSEFYQRSKFSVNDIQFRLLPDLREVGKLVTAYQKDLSISFDPRQIHGKNYFQGQPIYFMEPILCTYMDKSTGKITKRYFPNLLALTKRDYYNIFTTYKDAMSVWAKYRKKFRHYALPKKPKLRVYNLEGFLNEHAKQISDMRDTSALFRLIPSRQTYQYVQSIQQSTNSDMTQKADLSNQLILLARVWTNRFFWGMIKWYPPR